MPRSKAKKRKNRSENHSLRSNQPNDKLTRVGLGYICLGIIAAAVYNYVYNTSNNTAGMGNEQIEDAEDATCDFYLARSTIKDSGLGIFTTKRIEVGESVGAADIVVQIPDIQPFQAKMLRTLLFDYAWDGAESGGQYEGQRVYSMLPGIGASANGHHKLANTVQSYGPKVDNAGLILGEHPGAGAISHYHSFQFQAHREINAGDEILVDYGPNWFRERESKGMIKTTFSELARDVDWLKKHGMCLDNLRVGPSTNLQAGRGAFATRSIPKNTIVAPAPVLQILDRSSLEVIRVNEYNEHGRKVDKVGQQLLLNYCFGHKDSSVLFYPYSPLVNFINHNGTNPNVELRWSLSSQHKTQVGNMTIADLKAMEHTGLMLEFVALKDIQPGQEIFLDYGEEWQAAWDSHVNSFRHVESEERVYYANEFDTNSSIILTQSEQQTGSSSYPVDIFTSCYYMYKDAMHRGYKEGSFYVWKDSKRIFYERNLRPCIVLNRDERNEYYTVAMLNRFGLSQDERIPKGQKHFVTGVPRKAIKFSKKLYTTDQHSLSAFRHEIQIPNSIFPLEWRDLSEDYILK